jgi:hypothetical protein
MAPLTDLSAFERQSLKAQRDAIDLQRNAIDQQDKSMRLSKIGMWIQGLGFVGLIASLIVSIASVKSSTKAVEASTDQLSQAKLQSVYERQLDLWQLAAQQKDLAPYIVGGKRPADPQEQSEEDASSIRAARYETLDFYNYVFVLMAPTDTFTGQTYTKLAFDANAGRPDGIDPDDWNGWVAWSWTIRNGFSDAPGLCDQLGKAGGAYLDSFAKAVSVPEVCG